MATQKGVLQALWGEVRPAVEARRPDECRHLVRLVNRGKAGEAIARWTAALLDPCTREGAVLERLARRYGLDPGGSPDGGSDAARARLLEAARRKPAPALLNSRLLLDDPLPDRVWLLRGGGWKLYVFDGTRFAGVPLEAALESVRTRKAEPGALLLELRVSGRTLPNPKLPAFHPQVS